MNSLVKTSILPIPTSDYLIWVSQVYPPRKFPAPLQFPNPELLTALLGEDHLQARRARDHTEMRPAGDVS